MATITLTKEQTRAVLGQALKALETKNTRHSKHDFKGSIVRISKGEKFSSYDVAEENGMSAKSAGMRLRGLQKQNLVRKLGGGNWKRV